MPVSKKKQQKRQRLWKKIPTLREIMQGSLVTMKRTCGKPYCHCQKGEKHVSLYLSIKKKGRTRMIYIPRQYEKIVIKQTTNYRKMQEIIKEIGWINLELLEEKKRQRRCK